MGYAKNLKQALKKLGLNAFVAKLNIKGGKDWDPVILRVIESTKGYILMVTQLVPSSPYVKKELKVVKELQKAVIPCRQEGVSQSTYNQLPKFVRTKQEIRFAESSELADQVVAQLRNDVSQNEVSKATSIPQWGPGAQEYLGRLRRRLDHDFPKAKLRFHLTISSNERNGIPVDGVLKIVLNDGRVLLRGTAGAGKSNIAGEVVRQALRSGSILPVVLRMKGWTKEQSDRLKQIGGSLLSKEARLNLVLSASICDLNADLLRRIQRGHSVILVVDGINEVKAGNYGEEAVQKFFEVVDDWVRDNAPNASVLVTDRLATRGFLSDRWERYWVDHVHSDQVQRFIDKQFGRGVYGKLPRSDKELLGIPYFLDSDLNSAAPAVGSAASSILEFFKKRIGLDSGAIEALSKLAFRIYSEVGSLSFGSEIVQADENPAVERLREDGVIVEDQGKLQFDHQLKHDFLASRYLAGHPQLWHGQSYDLMTFESNSFECLSLVLEQLPDSATGDRFLKTVYDWNWTGAEYCLSRALRYSSKNITTEMEIAMLAVVAEKVLDPVKRTGDRSATLLKEMESNEAKRFAGLYSIQQVLRESNRLKSRKLWFLEWRRIFSLTRNLSLGEGEIRLIASHDSIMGWTMANVLRRFPLDELQLIQLRTIYSLLEDRTDANAIRWRVIHALGHSGDVVTVDLLFKALERDGYSWARYGAARSLVEIAARTKERRERSGILARLAACANTLPEKVLDEIAHCAFYRTSDREWRSMVKPLVRKVVDLHRGKPSYDRWLEISRNFDQWSLS